MKQELEQSLSTLWAMILRKLEEEGIEQTKMAYWRDGKGLSTGLVEETKSVCALGALNYAVEREWITEKQAIAIQLALDRAARKRRYDDIAHANDYGISLAEMKCWLEVGEREIKSEK